MKHRLNFITGVALLTVSATLATVIVLRDPDVPTSPAAGSEREPDQRRAADRPSSGPRLAAAQRSRATESGFAVRVDPADPDYPKLFTLAQQVESHALARLERMTRELDLSVGQQRRIFPMLVLDSQSYHPSMRIVGAAPHAPAIAGGTGDGSGDIAAELDPLQQDALLESSVDDLLLWREIIANLERQLEQQTDAVGNPAIADPEVPEAPSGGGRNLFDLAPQEK